MKVAFVTAEALPFSKTGGLGDVSRSLPMALAERGCDVTVFIPYYRSVAEWTAEHGSNYETLALPESVWIGDEQHALRFITLSGNPRHVFVQNDAYFHRSHPYLAQDGKDYPDNVSRFSFFCRAVLEYYRYYRHGPDVIHAQDWQAALMPVYLHTTYAGGLFANTRTLLTIHNLGYPGLFPADELYATGLSWDVFTPEALEYYGQLNLLKGGIVFADAVTAVSPTYAREIQTEELGLGLGGVLKANRSKLSGILNGIDTATWNPKADPHIAAKYSAAALKGKATCKKALQHELGLPLSKRALTIGIISRLDRQKGIEHVCDVFPRLSSLDIQLVVLGTGDKALEVHLGKLRDTFPEQVALHIGYDEVLAHRIIAGVDAFLIPSRYEPCGLTQMYCQRYGTVPIVRNTGGLADTVLNYTPRRLSAGKASGFSYSLFSSDKFADAIKRAAKLYFTKRTRWNKLMHDIMAIDHSWSTRAGEYLAVYDHLHNLKPRKGIAR